MGGEEVKEERKSRLIAQLKAAHDKHGPVNKEIAQRRRTYDEMHRAIIKALEEEAKTVPQIAELTGIESNLVFWHINALRKYNVLQEEKRRGDYAFYRKK
jgi:hypothetical protein